VAPDTVILVPDLLACIHFFCDFRGPLVKLSQSVIGHAEEDHKEEETAEDKKISCSLVTHKHPLLNVPDKDPIGLMEVYPKSKGYAMMQIIRRESLKYEGLFSVYV
jgi:hypothetical protein